MTKPDRDSVAVNTRKTDPTGMSDLYQRLDAAGFDESLVRDVILPDWWDDEIADCGAGRALAEGYISKHLGFSIADLRDPSKKLDPEIARRKYGHTP